jgi:hypothetical protein
MRQEPCGLIRHIEADPLQASDAVEGGVKWSP